MEMHNDSAVSDFPADRPFGLDPDRALIEQTKRFAVLFWLIAAAVGIPGNLFVLLAILRSTRLKTVSHILIFNLSLADLCFLLGIPVLVSHVASGEWLFGAAVCKIFLTSNGINQFASAIFLGVLSLDRYMAVCHPITSRPWRTVNVVIVTSLACWILVCLEMIPLLMFGTLIADPLSGRTQCMIYWKWSSDGASPNCDDDDYADNATAWNGSTLGNETADYGDLNYGDGFYISDCSLTFVSNLLFSRRVFTIYSFALSFLIPLLGTWFFYGRIIGSLWMRRQQFFQGGNRQRKTARVTMMGLAIVVMYTLCWLPYWVLQWSIELEATWTQNRRLLLPISYWAYCTQYLNSALNPFLYAILTDTFRDVVCKALRWTQRKASGVASQNSPSGRVSSYQIPTQRRLRSGRGWAACLRGRDSEESLSSSHKSSFRPLLSLLSGKSRSKSLDQSARSRVSREGGPDDSLLVSTPPIGVARKASSRSAVVQFRRDEAAVSRTLVTFEMRI